MKKIKRNFEVIVEAIIGLRKAVDDIDSDNGLYRLKTVTVQAPTATVAAGGTMFVPINLADAFSAGPGSIVGVMPYAGGGAGVFALAGYGGNAANCNISFRNITTGAVTPNANTRFVVTYRIPK